MQKSGKYQYYDKLILKKLMGTILPQEETDLEAWINADPQNRDSYESLRRNWLAEKDFIPEDERPQRRRTRTSAADSAKTAAGSSKKRNTSFYVFESVALTLLIVATVIIFMGLKERPSIHHAGREIRTITLSDSSRVTLEAGSVLLVPSNYGDRDRTVGIEGRALVEVTSDSLSRFTVSTDNSQIEVTGTTFVADFPEDGERDKVTVLTGELRLNLLDNPEKVVVVSAGKQALLDHNAGTISLQQADTMNALAWKERKLAFNDAPLSQVVVAIEDYFGVPVKVENTEMLKCTFTRTFNEPRIDDIIKALREELDVIVMREYERIVIDGRNSCP